MIWDALYRTCCPGLWLRVIPAFYSRLVLNYDFMIIRVSTKWLDLLRTFALFLRMKRNEFCAKK